MELSAAHTCPDLCIDVHGGLNYDVRAYELAGLRIRGASDDRYDNIALIICKVPTHFCSCLCMCLSRSLHCAHALVF